MTIGFLFKELNDIGGIINKLHSAFSFSSNSFEAEKALLNVDFNLNYLSLALKNKDTERASAVIAKISTSIKLFRNYEGLLKKSIDDEKTTNLLTELNEIFNSWENANKEYNFGKLIWEGNHETILEIINDLNINFDKFIKGFELMKYNCGRQFSFYFKNIIKKRYKHFSDNFNYFNSHCNIDHNIFIKKYIKIIIFFQGNILKRGFRRS